jgi:hypothetical protein
MRMILMTSIVAALTLCLASYSSDAGQGRGVSGSGDRVQKVEQERGQDHQRLHSKVEARDQSNLRNEQIYGHELMTEDELNRYREQMQKMSTAQAREKYQMQHEEKIRERAVKQNKDIVPPGQGPVYRGDLMSVQERNAFREQLRTIGSEEERARLLAQHREKMDRRANAVDKETEEAE